MRPQPKLPKYRVRAHGDSYYAVLDERGVIVHVTDRRPTALAGHLNNAYARGWQDALTIEHPVKPIPYEAFGAVGDGVTDDTAAIQAEIDAQDRHSWCHNPPHLDGHGEPCVCRYCGKKWTPRHRILRYVPLPEHWNDGRDPSEPALWGWQDVKA